MVETMVIITAVLARISLALAPRTKRAMPARNMESDIVMRAVTYGHKHFQYGSVRRLQSKTKSGYNTL